MKVRLEKLDLNGLEKLAVGFSKVLEKPMIVLLKGDLGSGKTTFVRALAKSLGCEEEVVSPTFALLNEYHGRLNIYHFDMYRLSSADEARGVGFEEYFDKKTLDGVSIVEWPENVEGLFSDVDFVISFEKESENTRKVTIEGKNLSNKEGK